MFKFYLLCFRYNGGNFSSLGAVQMAWDPVTILGVGSVFNAVTNTTYFVARFDQCANLADKAGKIGEKKGGFNEIFNIFFISTFAR